VISINSLKIQTKKIETDVSVFVHEMLHILGFSVSLFEFFPAYNDQPVYFQDTDDHYYYRGKNLLEEMRSHFACSALDKSKDVVIISFF
jgi:asparagine N-glycosylation enzyme membrane subunit Stt3